MRIATESHETQRARWPASGRHILAHFDAASIVVYQAYPPTTAEYAVAHQRLGGPTFSLSRMSWVKPNFLLHCSFVPAVYERQEDWRRAVSGSSVRLQWDPDHDPHGKPLERRALQLGLRGEVLRRYATEWPVRIEDISAFVSEQRTRVASGRPIETPREHVLPIADARVAARLGLSVDSSSASA